MARDRHTRPAPKPTTITEVARRYHAAAVALAQTLGVPLSEVLAQHRESVTAVFIECGRCELRLSASVKLPPLAAQGDGQTGAPDAAPEAGSEFLGNVPKNLGGRPVQPDSEATIADAPGSSPGGGLPLPTTIPADGDLPCAGQEIAALKPAALAMLIAKVATLAHAEGAGWAPLLHALERERARGHRPLAVVPSPDGGLNQN